MMTNGWTSQKVESFEQYRSKNMLAYVRTGTDFATRSRHFVTTAACPSLSFWRTTRDTVTVGEEGVHRPDRSAFEEVKK